MCSCTLIIDHSFLSIDTCNGAAETKKRPIPLEDLQPRSLRDLHDQMVRGSIEMELPVKKGAGDFLEPSQQGSLHLDWIGDQGQVCQQHQQLLQPQPRVSGVNFFQFFHELIHISITILCCVL